MRVASNRWICPVCSRPIGVRSGNGLATHTFNGSLCLGRGAEVATLDVYVPPDVPEPELPEPELLPVPWLPPALPVDRSPFRRWRSYGWSPEQIAAVTGPGALW